MRHCRQADSKAIARIVKNLAAVHSSSTTRILLEVPQPNSLNGKHSWYQTGFSYGVWQGALAAYGFEVGAPCILSGSCAPRAFSWGHVRCAHAMPCLRAAEPAEIWQARRMPALLKMGAQLRCSGGGDECVHRCPSRCGNPTCS